MPEGVPFIRGVNMKNGFIETTDMLHISKDANNLLWKSEVSPWDVLVSMSGSIGDVAIALPDWPYPINSNQDIAKIHFKSNVNPVYAYTFFLSKFGQNYLLREARGSVQQHVFLSQMENFVLPGLSGAFQNKISDVVLSAHAQYKAHNKSYESTEELLLSSLGIDKDKCNEDNIAVKSFSSFTISGRLDAEYYQPKYDLLFQQINNCKRVMSLGDIVKIKKSIEPGSDAYTDSGVPFLRVSDVSKYEIRHPEIYLDEKSYDLSNLIPRKDTILLSKDGSVGIAYKVQKDMTAVTSSALLHLQIISDEVLPDYLTLILNSFIVKMQAERDAGGSILQHWRIADIEKVQIPVADMDCQKNISEAVQESFAMRARAKRLLDIAIRAVEIAIEKGEEAALLYLDDCMEL